MVNMNEFYQKVAKVTPSSQKSHIHLYIKQAEQGSKYTSDLAKVVNGACALFHNFIHIGVECKIIAGEVATKWIEQARALPDHGAIKELREFIPGGRAPDVEPEDIAVWALETFRFIRQMKSESEAFLKVAPTIESSRLARDAAESKGKAF